MKAKSKFRKFLEKLTRLVAWLHLILIFSLSHFRLKAIEIEFSEESVTEYQHRDKQKEINVLEWISKVIMEPLQVRGMNMFERI